MRVRNPLAVVVAVVGTVVALVVLPAETLEESARPVGTAAGIVGTVAGLVAFVALDLVAEAPKCQ